MTEATPGLWLSLRLRDEDAMIAFLLAVGFTELMLYRDESGALVHGEYLWPRGGGVMVGLERDTPAWPQQPGTQAAYLATDDPDGVHEAALRAGAANLKPPTDEEYGRDCAVRDPDGNLWSFGSYAPGG